MQECTHHPNPCPPNLLTPIILHYAYEFKKLAQHPVKIDKNQELFQINFVVFRYIATNMLDPNFAFCFIFIHLHKVEPLCTSLALCLFSIKFVSN